jgi:hypothetical protein
MESDMWPEWAVAQLQECFINGIDPNETATLLGKTKDEICAKARELGLLIPPGYEEGEPSSSDPLNVFPRDFAAS